MPPRHPKPGPWLLVAASALGLSTGVAVAEAGSPELHGAAPTSEQATRLDALLAAAPKGPQVDPFIWKASVPADNPGTPEQIALGRKLYFDPALSRDGTVSCATCHDSTRQFTDRRPVSEGIGKQLGRRNAPTTMNAALLQSQFWDGREATLELQAGQPILNPVEMGQPDRATVVAKLGALPEYVDAFQKAYGRAIEYADIERAIAAFERTLIFLDAPLDRFLAGDADAISADAKAGWDLFNGKGRCSACHQLSYANPLGSDNRFHNVGVSARHQDFEGLAKKARAMMSEPGFAAKLDQLAIATDLSELGRFMVTRNPADVGAFRTPQLRNIGITAPYMHDGSQQTLWDTLDHYNKGGEANPWLDGGMEALALTEAEIDQLAAFMFALTDVRFSDENTKEMERQKAIAATQRPFRNDDLAQRRKLPFEDRVIMPTTPAAPQGDPK